MDDNWLSIYNKWGEIDEPDPFNPDPLDLLGGVSPLIAPSQFQPQPVTVPTPPAPVVAKPPTLREAISLGRVDLVRQILQMKNTALLNTPDQENGNTSLHLAVFHQQEEIFWELLRAGADLSITNYDNNTPFYRPKYHYPWAIKVWEQRASLPCKDKIPEACFKVLSKNFIANLAQFHGDLLILLQAVSSEKISDFVAAPLYGRLNNPLYMLAIQSSQYLELGKILLNHATPDILLQKNDRGQNFLSMSVAKRYQGFIDHARICQNGALMDTVNAIIPLTVSLPVDSSVSNEEIKSLQDKLKATQEKIQKIREQNRATLATIEGLKKSVLKGEAQVRDLSANIPALNSQIQACLHQIKESNKRALMQELAENKEKLRQIQEKAIHLETQLRAMDATEQTYRPSIGLKRPYEAPQNINATQGPDI
jgi:hypothetical protein